MNGTKHWWLRGALVTLGLALASFSAGCVTPTGPDVEEDDTEEVDSSVQELEEAGDPPETDDSPGDTDTGENTDDDGDDGEPQPVPWIEMTNAAPHDVDPAPGDPLQLTSHTAPSSGNSGH